MRATFAGSRPGPIRATQRSAAGANRSAAASAMYSGVRSGSARIRCQSDSGTGSTRSSSSALSADFSTLPRLRAAALAGFPFGARATAVHSDRPDFDGRGASMTTRATGPGEGILSSDMQAEREELIDLLTKGYWMEVETVMSYLANSINPYGVRAQEIIESLEQDVQEELGHARQYGERI